MGIYLLKAKNIKTKTSCKICSKLTKKTQKRRDGHCSGVFLVNREHILRLVLVSLLINFSRQIPSGLVPSLTNLKKHGSKLKFFVVFFQELEEINI